MQKYSFMDSQHRNELKNKILEASTRFDLDNIIMNSYVR
jgi:hypothetical protein